jgi:hypothetical protein
MYREEGIAVWQLTRYTVTRVSVPGFTSRTDSGVEALGKCSRVLACQAPGVLMHKFVYDSRYSPCLCRSYTLKSSETVI